MFHLALFVTALPTHKAAECRCLPRLQVSPIRNANGVSIEAQGHDDFRREAALASR